MSGSRTSRTTNDGRASSTASRASAPLEASTVGRGIRSSSVETNWRKPGSSSTTRTGDETAKSSSLATARLNCSLFKRQAYVVHRSALKRLRSLTPRKDQPDSRSRLRAAIDNISGACKNGLFNLGGDCSAACKVSWPDAGNAGGGPDVHRRRALGDSRARPWTVRARRECRSASDAGRRLGDDRGRRKLRALDTFVTDPVETSADDIFDGGQTKDTENLDEWLWKGGEPNDKNDIEHAFAAAYEHPTSGDLITSLRLDRMDNSGDAAAGFWFLKKPVEQKTIDADGDGDTENVFVFQGTNTLATHSVGDTLVQTDFTKGGSIERVEAYQWGVAPAGGPGSAGPRPQHLHGRGLRRGRRATTSAPGQQERRDRAWELARADGRRRHGLVLLRGPGGVAASGTFPTATFFEGGVNATKLFGADFCAAQLLAETRQSQSETSVLEDKAEAAFNLCAIDVTKTGPEKSKVGDDATYEIKVTNTGAVTLFKQSIVDDVIGDLTGTPTAAPASRPALRTITVDYTVQAGDPDPLVNTASVIYNRTSNLLGDEVTDSASHSVELFQPSITLTKEGDALEDRRQGRLHDHAREYELGGHARPRVHDQRPEGGRE